MTTPAAPAARAAAPDLTRSVSRGRDPWERYGWGIRAVWLVFLVFPVIALLGSGLPPWQIAVGLLLVTAFSAVYVLGAEHLDRRRRRRCEPDVRWGAAYALALVVTALGTVPLIGVGSLSFLPFVVSFGMFALPVLWAVGLGVASVVAAVAVALFVDDGEGTWVVAIIVFAVGVMTAGIRVVGERSRQYEAVSRELVLVAERERVTCMTCSATR